MIAKTATAVAFAMPLVLSGHVTVPVPAHSVQPQQGQASSAYGSGKERTVRVVARSYFQKHDSDHLRLKKKSSPVPLVTAEHLDLEDFASEFEAWSGLSRTLAEESFETQASAVRG